MSRAVIQAGWDDVPHLDAEEKARLSASLSPHQLEARSKGIPTLGSGAVYPVPVSEVFIDPIPLPAWMSRCYALDVGWKVTAALWGAHDRENDIIFVYSEHYRGQAEPAVHASAIKARGSWIPGLIDPASRGRSQVDGRQLIVQYTQEGLKLRPAENAVESGLLEVYQRLSTGRLKIFNTLVKTKYEYQLYRRDEHGKIVKENDHCLHPDTVVMFECGPRRIADMVGTSGRVYTTGGHLVEYRNCRMTASNRDVVKVRFDDGSFVVCTPDHKFMTTEGWTMAENMVGQWCELSQTPFKSSTESVTTCAGSISRETGSGSTVLSGLRQMGEKFLTGFTSTTRTMIDQIITLTTWSLSKGPIISACTGLVMGERHHSRHLMQPQSGTDQSLESSGTLSTTESTATPCTSEPIWSAPSAERPSTGAPTQASSAQTHARQKGGYFLGLITKIAIALNAARHLLSTSTARQKPAGRHAGQRLRCVAVEPAGVSDVYCMTVPETSSFLLANGVTSHNCMDCLRYLVAGIRHATTKPIEQTFHSFRAADSITGY